jgi:PAS domain S-box-containing protein
MKEGMIGWAAYSGKTILANDVSKEPRYVSVHLSETKSELDVPIIYREKVIGVLDIQSKDINIFGEEDVRTMETLARHIAVAIENARLYEKAQHEITQRKLAETSLKESEERYCTIFNGSKDAIFITGENTKFVDVNAAASELTGYTRKTLLTMGITDLHDSEDLHAFKAYFSRIMDGESIDSEANIRRKDGKKISVEFSNKRISIHGVHHMHTTARDISHRRLAEENIRQQTRAMETSMDGMAILNNKEEYIYLNKAHANVYGYDRTEELLGKTWRNLYRRDEIQRFERTIFPKLRKEGHWRGEAVGKRRDGTLFHQEVSLSILEGGGLVCIVRDITERKKFEEGLYESEVRLQTTLDSMEDAIHVINKDMKIILHNKRFSEWNRHLGLEENIEDKNLFDVFPFLSHKVRSEYRQVFKTGETLITEENNWFGDKEIYTETRKIPIFDHNTVIGVVTIIRDISESRQIVQELIVSEERFRSLFENTTIGLYRTTPDGQIVMANPALIRLLGYNSYSELASRNLEKKRWDVHPYP